MEQVVAKLLNPDRLFARHEVLARPSPVPQTSGIYAWYFDSSPSPDISFLECATVGDHRLLYVGISPSAPPRNGRPPSKNHLRKRIRGHMRGNASGSTLRLSLGCLLARELDIRLRRVGRTGRMTFAAGEAAISAWLQDHALVTWVAHAEPWLVERVAVPRLNLPLNLDMNQEHPFHPVLSSARRAARAQARELPVLEK